MNKKDIIEKLQGIIEELEAEEEIKTELKRGDIIECTNIASQDTFKAIYYGTTHYPTDIWVLMHNYDAPQSLSATVYIIKKTGEHIDLQGMLDTYC